MAVLNSRQHTDSTSTVLPKPQQPGSPMVNRIALLVAAVFLFSTPCAGADRQQPRKQISVTAAGDSSSCPNLIEFRCTSCHYETRICQALGKKRKREWKSTINRMVGHGAVISREERQILADCLVRQDPDLIDYCR